MTHDLYTQARNLAPELTILRRALHQIPELGSELPKTKALVRGELEKLGLTVRECGGGLISEISGTQDGPRILLRADMDGLPMAEESDLPFAAAGSMAHTCGHDLHTAMLLGGARILQSRRDQLRGTVRLLFQADEETAQGAAAMIAAGALEGVSEAFGLHTAPGQPTGLINCTPGAKTASFDRFEITLHGRGGHGAMPHLAIDPIIPAARICLALSELPARECPPGSGAVLTIGSIHGGSSSNSIPQQAALCGTFRTADAFHRAHLRSRVPEIARLQAQSARTEVTVNLPSGVPAVENQADMALGMARILEKVLGPQLVSREIQQLSASEDFALIAAQVPSLYMTIGTGTAEQGYRWGNHNPKVRYDEDALPIGAAVYAAAALYSWKEC